MQKIAKWFIAALVAASLFISCSELTGGGGQHGLITPDSLKGTEVQPGIEAAGGIDWANLGKTHNMDVFVLIGGQGGGAGHAVTTASPGHGGGSSGGQGGSMDTWNSDGSAKYQHMVKIIKNGDGQTFTLRVEEIQFGAMPLKIIALFPEVSLFKPEGTDTLTVKAKKDGLIGFIGQGTTLSDADWKDIGSLKKKCLGWGEQASIRPATSEVAMKDDTVLLKIDLDMNISKDTIQTTPGSSMEETLKKMAPMYTGAKCISATRGKYKVDIDKAKKKELVLLRNN